MSVEIRMLDRLCHDRALMRATFTAAQVLIDNSWLDWPAPGWDDPAIAVMADGNVAAVINWSFDEKELIAKVHFAFCSPAYPWALAVAAGALRKIARVKAAKEISFGCHPDNGPMMKLASKLRLKPYSIGFRVAVGAAPQPAEAPER